MGEAYIVRRGGGAGLNLKVVPLQSFMRLERREAAADPG